MMDAMPEIPFAVGPQQQAHPESVNARLANSLLAEKEAIITEWLARVESDSSIPSEAMTTSQLRDHLPQIFDGLTETLRRYGSDPVAEKAEKDAETHGALRWQQGYNVAELLREIKHFRTILIYHLSIFEETNEEFGMAARLFVTSTLHGFLDDIGIGATAQFLAEAIEARGQIERVAIVAQARFDPRAGSGSIDPPKTQHSAAANTIP